MKEFPSPSPAADLFVPNDKEQEYLQSHGLEIILLPNGARVFGALRRVEDQASASISFNFRAGASNEIAGKRGGLHIMEHMISSEAGYLSQSQDTHFNANTSGTRFGIEVGGIANPDFRSYGVWPLLELIEGQLTESTELDQESLDAEKANVASEIAMRYADPDWLTPVRSNDLLLDPANPLRADIAGPPEDRRVLTVKDMWDLRDRTFSPDLLDVVVFASGSASVYEAVRERVVGMVSSMERKGHRFQESDRKQWDVLNPELIPGSTYVADTSIRNGRALVKYVWPMNVPQYSDLDAAINFLPTPLNSRLFEYIRRRGISYSAGASVDRLDQILNFALNIDLPSQEIDLVEYAQSIRDGVINSVIGDLHTETLAGILEDRKLGWKATPPTIGSRFNMAANSYVTTGRILDYDKVGERLNDVTSEEVEPARQLLLSRQPYTFIIGDLPGQ